MSNHHGRPSNNEGSGSSGGSGMVVVMRLETLGSSMVLSNLGSLDVFLKKLEVPSLMKPRLTQKGMAGIVKLDDSECCIQSDKSLYLLLHLCLPFFGTKTEVRLACSPSGKVWTNA